VRRGADVVVAQGGEAGGHSGYVSTMALVPQVVDVAGDVPVVAAGGIADGRGLGRRAGARRAGRRAWGRGSRVARDGDQRGVEGLLVAAASRDAVHEPLLELLLPPYNRPALPGGRPRAAAPASRAEWAGRRPSCGPGRAGIAPERGAAALAGGGHEHIPFAGQSAGWSTTCCRPPRSSGGPVREAEEVLARLSRHPALPRRQPPPAAR
jgi:nitronate monooxygenase/enoyl-[acyl-carrier protein] reductase II